ncbi:MAG: cellulase family glycosylhydrolase [Salinigranum sp.]
MSRTLTDVHGAVYVPARAYNAYQIWADYDPGTAERDLGYASALHLNAVRTFLSFEHWRERPDAHAEAVSHFLGVASDAGLGVVPVLFESAGADPTSSTLADRDPATAAAVRSPAGDVIRTRQRWSGGGGGGGILGSVRQAAGLGSDRGPREYLEWFVDRFGDDDRVLALEVMNEPGGWEARERFAGAMLRAAREAGATVPLTMGCKSVENNRLFDDVGLDVFQFHHNLPSTADGARAKFAAVAEAADEAGVPVWLTEWQRTTEQSPDVLLPHYASLAAAVRESDLDGDFFWSLMLKPAYLPTQRERGRMNGVFHEDGAVFSLDDARAVAADSSLDLPERRRAPAWLPEGVVADVGE